MKILFLFLISIASFSVVVAQNYDFKVEEHSTKVGKIQTTGMAIHIDLDKDEIKDDWKKRLKGLGKVESQSGVYKIESANMNEVSSQPVRVLSKIESTSKGTRVWISVNTGTGYVKSGTGGHGNVKKYLEDFAKRMYKTDIERQVTDAQKALETSRKNQAKVIGTGEQLQKDLEENEQEKIELDQSIEQNTSDQEAAVQNVADMEKALELVNAKLEKLK